MRRRHHDVVVTIAARAALRVAPLVFHARYRRAGASGGRELEDLMGAIFRALAPAQIAPQIFYAENFRSGFRAAADAAANAAKRGTYATSRAVCDSASAVAEAAATRYDDQLPRAAFAAQAVIAAAEACARGSGSAEYAARVLAEASERPDANPDVDDRAARRARRASDRAARAAAAAAAAEESGAALFWEEILSRPRGIGDIRSRYDRCRSTAAAAALDPWTARLGKQRVARPAGRAAEPERVGGLDRLVWDAPSRRLAR